MYSEVEVGEPKSTLFPVPSQTYVGVVYPSPLLSTRPSFAGPVRLRPRQTSGRHTSPLKRRQRSTTTVSPTPSPQVWKPVREGTRVETWVPYSRDPDGIVYWCLIHRILLCLSKCHYLGSSDFRVTAVPTRGRLPRPPPKKDGEGRGSPRSTRNRAPP